VQRMCKPAKGYVLLPLLLETDPSRSARRAMIVDLALSLTGSQLIASVLPTVHFLSLDLHSLIL
jgi:hypothetical protein